MTTLSNYELRCGKVQELLRPYAKVELYQEHECYHVRRFSYTLDMRPIRDAWLCYDNYLDAQRSFKRQVEIMES